MKKYDSYKECVIHTDDCEYKQLFTNDWTFKDIEYWMLDTYCIEKEDISYFGISNVTLYKHSN